MGMLPDIWGPHFWNAINAIALSYPDKPDIKDQQNVTVFFTSLKDVLPCEKCQEHFKQNLKKFPLAPALSSRKQLIHWVIDVHNAVNESHGKKKLTYEQGLYEMERNLYGNQREFTKYHLIFGLVGVIGVLWYFRKTKFFKNLMK